MQNSYHFVTRWRVEGTCGEVADVLGDPLALPKWWPAVYLGVEQLHPSDGRGLGRRVRALTTGWLPYKLRWEFVTIDSRYPYGFTINASGDFEGTGVWTFEQDSGFVNITYDWRIRAEKPFIRELSFLLKPIFAANHRWAMDQGEKSLTLELARRRAPSEEARAAVLPPPAPVTYSAALLVAGTVAVGATLVWIIARSDRRVPEPRRTPRVLPVVGQGRHYARGPQQ